MGVVEVAIFVPPESFPFNCSGLARLCDFTGLSCLVGVALVSSHSPQFIGSFGCLYSVSGA